MIESTATRSTLDTESLDVLIVDDDQDACDTVAFTVRGLGHSCRLAQNGVEAW